MMRRGVAFVATLVLWFAFSTAPAFAVSMVGPTTGTVSGWSLASTGSNSLSGGTLTISALLSSYTVTVQADKSKMSEYNSGAYVSGGKTLAASLHVISARTGGTGVSCSGVGQDASVGTSATTVASGPGGLLCSDIYSINLSQTTSITDTALASGHSYHIILTYTLSGGL
jgi:hypothetical protein